MNEDVRVAVVTGGHSFDVPNFHRLFRSLRGVDAYIQSLDDFASSSPSTRSDYDVVLFYIMQMATPVDEGLPWHHGRPLTALSELGSTGQGIVVLHHALLAFPDWQPWSDIVGISDRRFGFHMGQTVRSLVRDDHPINRGLRPWTMGDETYTMADARDDSSILISYDHPLSMKTIAWTRQYRSSPVFCYQAGHDNTTWSNASFQDVLRRGILWSTGRLEPEALEETRKPAGEILH